MDEGQLRELMTSYARSLFERGYGCGTSGNLSARLPDGGLLLSPTNVSLGRLRPEELTRLDAGRRHVGGLPPTKEAWLHHAVYEGRPTARAVVHLHSTYAVALSCLRDRDPHNVLPAITPYSIMHFGRLAKVGYARPGDDSRKAEISALMGRHRAVLLSNHGPVVCAESLPAAMAAAEELEETARLFFILRDWPHDVLSDAQVRELNEVFGLEKP